MSQNDSLTAARAALDPTAAMMNKDADPTRKGRRKRKVSYLTLNKIVYVDFKEIAILRRFMNDRGRILPARQNGNTAKQQRMVTQAIKRAREMALLPFVVTEIAAPSPRRSYGDGGEAAPTANPSYSPAATGATTNVASDENA